MGVLNYEMESATLLTICTSQGLRAGMVAGVIVNRTQQEIPNAETMAKTESDAIKIVLGAAPQADLIAPHRVGVGPLRKRGPIFIRRLPLCLPGPAFPFLRYPCCTVMAASACAKGASQRICTASPLTGCTKPSSLACSISLGARSQPGGSRPP